MARGIRFCRTFLQVALVKQHTAMLESHAFRMRYSHGSVLFDSRNVQKSVTQIIYLGPLPTWHRVKQNSCEKVLCVPWIFAKLSWSLSPSLSSCSDLAGTLHHHPGLFTYYQDIGRLLKLVAEKNAFCWYKISTITACCDGPLMAFFSGCTMLHM